MTAGLDLPAALVDLQRYPLLDLEVPDFELPDDHPRRHLGAYAVGVIAYDMFPPESPLRRLYEWEPMMEFIAAVLQRGRLFRYADPLGALNLAVMGDGD